jgi:hypothetical protein
LLTGTRGVVPWRAHGFPGVCSAASVRPSLMLVVRRRPPSIRALRWTLTLGAHRRWRIHSGGGSLLVALVIIRVAESTAASLLRVGCWRRLRRRGGSPWWSPLRGARLLLASHARRQRERPCVALPATPAPRACQRRPSGASRKTLVGGLRVALLYPLTI